MAKTALELTGQEWQAYRPGATAQQLDREPESRAALAPTTGMARCVQGRQGAARAI